MSQKIVAPEGMLKAAMDAWDSCGHDASHRVDTDYYKRRFLEAALRWLSDEMGKMQKYGERDKSEGYNECLDDIRRMFLEPEVPEEVRDLVEGMSWESSTWKLIIEAFRRGQGSKL